MVEMSGYAWLSRSCKVGCKKQLVSRGARDRAGFE
jgi:hypothetical protein